MADYKKLFGIKKVGISYGENNTVVTVTTCDGKEYSKEYEGTMNAAIIVSEEVPQFKTWE
jgi:ribosomal protein S11